MARTIYIFTILCFASASGQSILTPPTDSTKEIGDYARFYCVTELGSLPLLKWEHNNIVVYSYDDEIEQNYDPDNYNVTQDGKTFTLTVSNVDFNDGGSYTCRLINDHRTANLVVLGKPQLKETSDSDPDKYERSVNYTCTASYGGPPEDVLSPKQQPKLKILFDGEEKEDGILKLIQEQNKYTIGKFHNAQLTGDMDGKTVICELTTGRPYNYIFDAVKIEVNRRPDPEEIKEEKEDDTTPQSNNSTGVALGVIFGLVVPAVAVGVGIYLWKKEKCTKVQNFFQRAIHGGDTQSLSEENSDEEKAPMLPVSPVPESPKINVVNEKDSSSGKSHRPDANINHTEAITTATGEEGQHKEEETLETEEDKDISITPGSSKNMKIDVDDEKDTASEKSYHSTVESLVPDVNHKGSSHGEPGEIEPKEEGEIDEKTEKNQTIFEKEEGKKPQISVNKHHDDDPTATNTSAVGAEKVKDGETEVIDQLKKEDGEKRQPPEPTDVNNPGHETTPTNVTKGDGGQSKEGEMQEALGGKSGEGKGKTQSLEATISSAEEGGQGRDVDKGGAEKGGGTEVKDQLKKVDEKTQQPLEAAGVNIPGHETTAPKATGGDGGQSKEGEKQEAQGEEDGERNGENQSLEATTLSAKGGGQGKEVGKEAADKVKGGGTDVGDQLKKGDEKTQQPSKAPESLNPDNEVIATTPEGAHGIEIKTTGEETENEKNGKGENKTQQTDIKHEVDTKATLESAEETSPKQNEVKTQPNPENSNDEPPSGDAKRGAQDDKVVVPEAKVEGGDESPNQEATNDSIGEPPCNDTLQKTPVKADEEQTNQDGAHAGAKADTPVKDEDDDGNPQEGNVDFIDEGDTCRLRFTLKDISVNQTTREPTNLKFLEKDIQSRRVLLQFQVTNQEEKVVTHEYQTEFSTEMLPLDTSIVCAPGTMSLIFTKANK